MTLIEEPSAVSDVESEDSSLFYQDDHRRLFGGIIKAHRDGDATAIGVLRALKAQKQPKSIQALATVIPAKALPIYNLSNWVMELRELRSKRNIIRVCAEAIDACHEHSSDAVAHVLQRLPDRLTRAKPKSWIKFRSPSEIQSWEAPEGHVLVGDQQIVRGNWTVIGGHGGVGKSRATTALAIAGATGQPWFGSEVHCRFKTMVIQTENGPYRLKDELYSVSNLDDWLRISEPPDYGLCFNSPEFRMALSREIEAFKPDVIILDPWNATIRDATQKDTKESVDHIDLVLPKGPIKPAIVIVTHTRKPSGDVSKGRSLLHDIVGTYALGAKARCVFIMQAGSDDPEDDQVVWTCAKNNDGRQGERTAWVRRNGLFEPCQDFDWKEFDEQGKGANGKYDPGELAALLPDGKWMPYTEWLALAQNQLKMVPRTFARYVKKCIEKGFVEKNEDDGHYRKIIEF